MSPVRALDPAHNLAVIELLRTELVARSGDTSITTAPPRGGLSAEDRLELSTCQMESDDGPCVLRQAHFVGTGSGIDVLYLVTYVVFVNPQQDDEIMTSVLMGEDFEYDPDVPFEDQETHDRLIANRWMYIALGHVDEAPAG